MLLEKEQVDDEEDLELLKTTLYDPCIRVNERSFPEFNDNRATQKVFKFNDKNKDIGCINTYRSTFEDLNIKYSNTTLVHYP